MAVVFDLTLNPFHVLGAPLDASADDIFELGQDAVVDGRSDEATAAKAQQTLIPPRLRLEAEVGWFADVSSEAAISLSNDVLRGDQDSALAAARQASPLAKANAAAHICGRFPGSTAPLSVLIQAWSELDRGKAFQAIATSRQRAGIPRPDREHFDEALKKLEDAHARQAVGSIEVQNARGAAALTGMVETAIKQNSLGPMLRRIVREYDRASELRLEEVREMVMSEMDRCRVIPHTASKVVERLQNLLVAWDDINQPVQLLEQAEGHEEERSRRLCIEIRDFCLWLANEKGRHREALALTRALLTTFPELDSIASKLGNDVQTLEEIVRRLPTQPAPPAKVQQAARQEPVTRAPPPASPTSRVPAAERRTGIPGAIWVVVAIVGGLLLFSQSEAPSPRTPSPSPTLVARPPSPSLTTEANSQGETAPIPYVGRPLTTPEIRYCVFQDARLNHLREMIFEISETEVNRFNELVDTWNARCGSYTYREGALAPVQAEALREDAKLQREASAILAGWRGSQAPASTAAPQLARPAADPSPQPTSPNPPFSTGTIETPARLLDLRNADDARIVQRRLQELGYYGSSVDGGFGARSVAALRAFKRDHPRLPADAEWDIETQRELLNQ